MPEIYNSFGASLFDIQCWPYRTATVTERFLAVPRDTMDNLERQLAEAVGRMPDNHTCYAFNQDDYRVPKAEGKVYVLFTDSTAVFGWGIEEKGW